MDNQKIAAAFVKAQMSFAPALKTSTNPHFKSKYVNLDGCIEAVIDSLGKNGIALIQKTHDCDGGVSVETVLLHESGEQISGGILRVPALKNDAQAYGSALTYARRYSLMSTCGIAPEDDDGHAASHQQNKPAAPALTAQQVSQITDMATACNDLVAQSNVAGAKDLIDQSKLTDTLKKALWAKLNPATKQALKG